MADEDDSGDEDASEDDGGDMAAGITLEDVDLALQSPLFPDAAASAAGAEADERADAFASAANGHNRNLSAFSAGATLRGKAELDNVDSENDASKATAAAAAAALSGEEPPSSPAISTPLAAASMPPRPSSSVAAPIGIPAPAKPGDMQSPLALLSPALGASLRAFHGGAYLLEPTPTHETGGMGVPQAASGELSAVVWLGVSARTGRSVAIKSMASEAGWRMEQQVRTVAPRDTVVPLVEVREQRGHLAHSHASLFADGTHATCLLGRPLRVLHQSGVRTWRSASTTWSWLVLMKRCSST